MVRDGADGVRERGEVAACGSYALVRMSLPAVLGIGRPAASALHLAAALSVVVGVVSMREVLRIGRLPAMPLGATTALAPLAFGGAPPAGRFIALLLGIAIVAFSLPRGAVREHYGDWVRLVR